MLLLPRINLINSFCCLPVLPITCASSTLSSGGWSTDSTIVESRCDTRISFPLVLSNRIIERNCTNPHSTTQLSSTTGRTYSDSYDVCILTWQEIVVCATRLPRVEIVYGTFYFYSVLGPETCYWKCYSSSHKSLYQRPSVPTPEWHTFLVLWLFDVSISVVSPTRATFNPPYGIASRQERFTMFNILQCTVLDWFHRPLMLSWGRASKG